MIVLLVIVALAIGVLWWLLIETEGVYLGRPIVIWLYDVYASRYDGIKEYEPEYEFALLAMPIMSAIEPHISPLVLDVATGTGRLPIALLSHAHFDGFVVGVDLSKKMLRQAAIKLADYQGDVRFVRAPAEALPFYDSSVDVVTCLESLEFMADPKAVIGELVRVLRPGGLMLLTNRVNTRWMPGKTLTDVQLGGILSDHSMIDIKIEPWQVDYHQVWAFKRGDSQLIGRRPLNDLLNCPVCSSHFETSGRCSRCGFVLSIDDLGIVDITHLNDKRNPH